MVARHGGVSPLVPIRRHAITPTRPALSCAPWSASCADDCRGRIEGGPDSIGYELMAEMLPLLSRLKVVTAAEIGLETLAPIGYGTRPWMTVAASCSRSRPAVGSPAL
jgi:hypothetical protein